MDPITINLLITLLTPVLISLLKRYVLPQLPRAALPALAPVIGALLQAAQSAVTDLPVQPEAGAAAGLAGVGVREVLDQLKKVARGR